MDKIVLGNSEIKVSKLGLGCISFGSSLNKKISFELMDTFFANGGNFLDTANNYAFWDENSNGSESETVIGEWLSLRKNRNEVIIATKIGALPNETGPQDFTNLQGNSRGVILREVDKCLSRLQTDYIDLLYLHIDDRNSDLRETMKTLYELKKTGKIKAYGASNFKTWRLEQARNICLELGIPFFSAIEQRYSYLTPVSDYDCGVQEFVNDELVDYLNYYGDITLVGYSVLLAGQYLKKEISDDPYNTKINQEKLKQLNEREKSPNSWVLNWVTKQFGGSIALVTTSSIEHLKENIDFINNQK